jgi:uncharacterized protein YqfA (UPF0365 family)
MSDAMFWTVAAVLMLIPLLGMFAFMLVTFSPWMRAFMSGAPVTITSLLGMRLRGTPVKLVIDAYIQLRVRGKDVSLADVERQYIAEQHRVRSSGDLVDLVEQHAAA